jgi:hypothetical protein
MERGEEGEKHAMSYVNLLGMVGSRQGAARHAIHDISFRIDKGKGGSEQTSDSSRIFFFRERRIQE